MCKLVNLLWKMVWQNILKLNLGIIMDHTHVDQPSDCFIHIPMLGPLQPSFPYLGLVVDTASSSVPPISYLSQPASTHQRHAYNWEPGGKDEETCQLLFSKLTQHSETCPYFLQKPSDSVSFRMTLASVSSTIKPNTNWLRK